MKDIENTVDEAEVIRLLWEEAEKEQEATITEYQAMQEEVVALFNSLSEEMQQQYLEYLRELIADGTGKRTEAV